MRPHTPEFAAVRDQILALEDEERARLARFFGCMTEPQARLGELRAVLPAIAALDDVDLERLVDWFSLHVSRYAAGRKPADRFGRVQADLVRRRGNGEGSYFKQTRQLAGGGTTTFFV